MIVWKNDDFYYIPLLFPSNLGALFLDKPLVLQLYNTKELCGVKNYGHHGHTDPESHLHHTPPAESSQWHLPHQPVKSVTNRHNASQQVNRSTTGRSAFHCLQFVLYAGDSKDLQRPDGVAAVRARDTRGEPPMKSPISKPSTNSTCGQNIHRFWGQTNRMTCIKMANTNLLNTSMFNGSRPCIPHLSILSAALARAPSLSSMAQL